MRIRFVGAFVAVASICAAAGCSSSGSRAGEKAGRSASAIQGGTDDHTDSFAVGVCGGAPGNCSLRCSGALIAPNLVVSARHCVEQSPEQIDCATAAFGGPLGNASDFYITTDYSMLQGTKGWHRVAQIITPTPTGVCGNDLSLLILKDVVSAAEATPVTPDVQYPVTDHSRYSTSETAIGYGLSAPTPLTGPAPPDTSGLRRIRQNIDIQCIPLDPDPSLDCYKISDAAPAFIAENEFQAGNGTCSGDSGSSAFEQLSFNAGKPVSLGVLSRGGSDGTTCIGAVYTRLDKWRDLIVQTAQTAATLGGYTAPEWTQPVPVTPDAGVAKDAGHAPTPGSLGSACKVEKDCASNLCVIVPDSSPAAYVCSQACSDTNACPSGFICENDTCFAGTTEAIDAGNVDASIQVANDTNGTSSGCAIGARSRGTKGAPWSLALGAIAAGVLLARRRRTER